MSAQIVSFPLPHIVSHINVSCENAAAWHEARVQMQACIDLADLGGMNGRRACAAGILRAFLNERRALRLAATIFESELNFRSLPLPLHRLFVREMTSGLELFQRTEWPKLKLWATNEEIDLTVSSMEPPDLAALV